MPQRLHIVCLDEPDPPNYGGAIDMYFKIVALHNIGVRIVLHVFHYKTGRGVDSLKEYCDEIYIYARKNFVTSAISLPFIIGSRINRVLISRLNADDGPILLEGIHCAGIISSLHNKGRVVLRLHNDEARYYSELSKTEPSSFKKIYLKRESALLQKFQNSLPPDLIAAFISNDDKQDFQIRYGLTNAAFIPCFHPWENTASTVSSVHDDGRRFCLYHGNMAVSENEEAARWLVLNVFRYLNLPLVIAGKSISTKLKAAVTGIANVRLVNEPTNEELEELVGHAHINVLPSMNATGVKLKLLHALFSGKFCITNPAGIKGSGFNRGVLIADQPMAWMNTIQKLMVLEFTATDKAERQDIFLLYNNEMNARKLSALWSHYQ